MLPEDRLACIVPRDGTLDGEAPALFGSTTTLPPSSNRSGTATTRTGPAFRVSHVPGKVEHGRWSWPGSREKGFSRLRAASMV